MYKVLKESLKELSIGILILGLVRELIYYRNFKIPIKYFLSITELWLVISDDLLFFAPMLFAILYVFNKPIYFPKNESKTVLDKIFLGVFTFISIPIIYLLITSTSYLQALSFGITLIFYIVLLISMYSTTNNTLKLLSVSTFLFLVIFNITNDIRTVQLGKYKGTYVVLDDNTRFPLTDTSSTYFIGKTDKYIFFHNKNIDLTKIISLDKVKEIDLKVNLVSESK